MGVCNFLPVIDWNLIKDISSVTGTVISGCALIVAVVFGIKGLKTWKLQTAGATSHELSVKILTEIYLLRMSFRFARSGEFSFDLSSNPLGGDPNNEGSIWRQMAVEYDERIEAIASSLSKLEAFSFESSARWDDEIRRSVEKLNEIFYRLIAMIYKERHLMKMVILGEESIERYSEEVRDDILYISKNKEDAFGNEITKVIEHVEIYLRSKIIAI